MLAEDLISSRLLEVQIEEAALTDLIWKKLPGPIKTKVGMKRLVKFLAHLDDEGSNIQDAASYAGLPTAVAVDLMSSIERTGLL